MQVEQKYWIVTASADHAAHGLNLGIVQACHGKAAPLRRMMAGDGVVIYSPKAQRNGGERLMAFTAIGRVTGEEPYVFDMGGGFLPWRRGVQWQPHAQAQSIRPLLDQLDLTRGQASWGMIFRFGLTRISRADFSLLARAMVAADQAIPFSPYNPHIG